ncbi:MAG TPA: acetyl-CoA C-acyltransferase [Candidatus Binatia bacterium]|nr:acetyl-CoA C-acyltransferase [Candidatus Binatia bacterium]
MRTHEDPVVIAGAARTAIGAFQGALSSLRAPDLGARAIAVALERSGLEPGDVDEVLMGCVLPAGIGQAPARQAALLAGIPDTVPATTVNKVCGSGMKSVMVAHDALVAGTIDVAIAGGMESMSNAPYLVSKARSGLRLGHAPLQDHMFLDGLEDAYGESTRGRLMGTFAEDAARHFGFTREDQDAFARESLLRARCANEDGTFAEEIATLTIRARSGDQTVTRDEQPFTAIPEKIPTLKPAFAADGSVTAANSSSISDGAAALVLTRQSEAERRGVPPLARIVGHASYAGEPRWFTTAPVHAIDRLLGRVGWKVDDVDLWEINEAFAVVALAAIRQAHLPQERVNVNGGACALGHPIGASGARILVTLISALRQSGLSRGVAAICIGGGEATAVAVELVG